MRGVFSVGVSDSLMKLNLLRYCIVLTVDRRDSLWSEDILTDEGSLLCGRERLPIGNKIYSLMRGVFSVGGSDSLMVMRKTVMESRAEIPRVTYTKKRQYTPVFFYQNLVNFIMNICTNLYKMFL
jgi:hypothetical protein